MPLCSLLLAEHLFTTFPFQHLRPAIQGDQGLSFSVDSSNLFESLLYYHHVSKGTMQYVTYLNSNDKIPLPSVSLATAPG